MEQEWKSIKSSGYVFEYPIEDESDPMVAQVQTWLALTCGTMNVGSWVAGFIIRPSAHDRIKPFGLTWSPSVEHHPLWIRVTFENKENAAMFRLAWC